MKNYQNVKRCIHVQLLFIPPPHYSIIISLQTFDPYAIFPDPSAKINPSIRYFPFRFVLFSHKLYQIKIDEIENMERVARVKEREPSRSNESGNKGKQTGINYYNKLWGEEGDVIIMGAYSGF